MGKHKRTRRTAAQKAELKSELVTLARSNAPATDWETPGSDRRDQNPASGRVYEAKDQNEPLPFDDNEKPRITPDLVDVEALNDPTDGRSCAIRFRASPWWLREVKTSAKAAGLSRSSEAAA